MKVEKYRMVAERGMRKVLLRVKLAYRMVSTEPLYGEEKQVPVWDNQKRRKG